MEIFKTIIVIIFGVILFTITRVLWSAIVESSEDIQYIVKPNPYALVNKAGRKYCTDCGLKKQGAKNRSNRNDKTSS